MNSRRGSSGDLREVDNDGFVKVVRSSSNTALSRSVSDAAVLPKPPKPTKRATSYSNPPARPLAQQAKPQEQPPAAKPEKSFPNREQCEKKTKNLLKEYFVGGDTKDAVLSIEELVGIGHPGARERGTVVVEAGILLVLEDKEENVKKFVTVLLRCVTESKIEKESFAPGFNDPLEFLRDIEIDAPLAGSLLAFVAAECIKSSIFNLDFLLKAPVDFRTDGKAAHFAAKIVKKIGGEPSADNLAVIGSLMTEKEKAEGLSAATIVSSLA